MLHVGLVEINRLNPEGIPAQQAAQGFIVEKQKEMSRNYCRLSAASRIDKRKNTLV